MVPGIGPEVRGASWTPVDGIANPLKLLRALHMSLCTAGRGLPAAPSGAEHPPKRRRVPRSPRRPAWCACSKVVLASGPSNKRALGEQVGLHGAGAAAARPDHRAGAHPPPAGNAAFRSLRQTDEGTWLIGDSQEEAGYVDNRSACPCWARWPTARCAPCPPCATCARCAAGRRCASCPRTVFPFIEQSETCPGAFVATCHSGVTLAAAHALELAPMIAAGAAGCRHGALLHPEVSCSRGLTRRSGRRRPRAGAGHGRRRPRCFAATATAWRPPPCSPAAAPVAATPPSARCRAAPTA